MIVALVSGIGVAFSGHEQAQHLMKSQPMKMAASEALWDDSGDPAAWTVLANIDADKQENKSELSIPYALSYLAYKQFSGDVPGMKTLQKQYEEKYGEGNYIPPVKTTFWSFRIMAGSGLLMIVAALTGLYLSFRKRLETSKWFLRTMVALIAFPFIANTAGWIMTEIGRQPWTVFGILTTAQSVSPNVSAGMLLFSVIAFTAIYLVLALVLVYLFVREIKKGLHTMTTIMMIPYRQTRLIRRFTMVSLNELWFILVAVLFIGFSFLKVLISASEWRPGFSGATSLNGG